MQYIEKILHIVIPHERNKNIPHLLKKEFILVLSALVVVLFYVNENNLSLIRRFDLTGAIYPAVLTDLTNKDRTSMGFAELSWNNTLESAAQMKASDMINSGYFAHTSPAGLTPWHWLEKAKYNFIYAGENLALDFTESTDVERAWLNSPTHRANVLSKNYTEIGIVALDGNYQGRNTTFVVEFFGKPQSAKVVQAPIKKEKTPVVPKNENIQEPEVAGASVQTTTKPKVETSVKVLQQTEQNTEKFIAVENLEATEPVVANDTTYQNRLSTWYMRLAVSPTNAIKAIYSTILGFVLLAMLLVLSKEYQMHHTKHLIMGMLLIVITGIFLYSLHAPSITQAFYLG
jgi:hypothetical protein